MGNLNTRSTGDYVMVGMNADERGYVHVDLFVYNLENAVKARMRWRDRDDEAMPYGPFKECEYWPRDDIINPYYSDSSSNQAAHHTEYMISLT